MDASSAAWSSSTSSCSSRQELEFDRDGRRIETSLLFGAALSTHTHSEQNQVSERLQTVTEFSSFWTAEHQEWAEQVRLCVFSWLELIVLINSSVLIKILFQLDTLNSLHITQQGLNYKTQQFQVVLRILSLLWATRSKPAEPLPFWQNRTKTVGFWGKTTFDVFAAGLCVWVVLDVSLLHRNF